MDVFITFVAMQKYTLLFIALFIVSCSDNDDTEPKPFYVADNGVTIKARDWVTVGTTADLNGVTYTAVDLPSLKEWINDGKDLSKVVTTFVSDTTHSQFAVLFNRKVVGFFPIKGIEGTAEFVNMVINPWIGLGEATWKYTATGKWDKDLLQKEYFAEKMDIVPDFLEVEEGSVAAFNSDVVAFFSNYGLITKGLKQIPLLAKDPTKPYRLGKELVIGALTDVTAFDPEDGTAVDFLVTRYPSLQNPVFQFLTTDEDDSDAMIKLKQALEGAGITGGIHIIAKGLGLFKQYNQGVVARYKGKKLEQAQIIEEANKKGIIVDDAADAAAKIKESEFIGPKQVKPKPVPKQKEVLLDEKQLDESIKNTNDIVNIDLPFNVKNWKSSLDVQVVIEKVVKSMNKSYKDKWEMY